MSFYTEKLRRDPRFHSTACLKDMMLVEPGTRLAITQLIAEASQHGHHLTVLETFRSQARQIQLYNQRLSELREVGCHGYGVAADIGIEGPSGAVDWKADYALLGALAEKHGLIWGGTWGLPKCPHSFRDFDHVQRVPVFRQEALFKGEFYPSENYDPYEDMRQHSVAGMA